MKKNDLLKEEHVIKEKRAIVINIDYLVKNLVVVSTDNPKTIKDQVEEALKDSINSFNQTLDSITKDLDPDIHE